MRTLLISALVVLALVGKHIGNQRIGYARSKNSRRGRVKSTGENKAIIQWTSPNPHMAGIIRRNRHIFPIILWKFGDVHEREDRGEDRGRP